MDRELKIMIVRLNSGEDIVADCIFDEENDSVQLNNPMRFVFKRLPGGKNVMIMMPWLPVELVQENVAHIYSSDILTMVDVKDTMVKHYINTVNEVEDLVNGSELEEESIDELFGDDSMEDDSEEDVDRLEEILSELKGTGKNLLH